MVKSQSQRQSGHFWLSRPRGSAARNEQLAKARAQTIDEALVSAGIDASRIEMRKPADLNGGADLNEARRVEVSVE